jgi:AmmeMemoRadiSam system protein B
MKTQIPSLRKDLQFIPIHHAGKQMILIQDHISLVPKGSHVDVSAYRFLTMLDGRKTIRDLQIELMRQRGGVLVGSDEVIDYIHKLDEIYLLESEHFNIARDKIIMEFGAQEHRPCVLCGNSYPEDSQELKKTLDQILAHSPEIPSSEKRVQAIVAPHIDISAGAGVYASAYQMVHYTTPSRVVILGVGHQMSKGLFSLTEKNFVTPLGLVKNESSKTHELKQACKDVMAENDFDHRSEHSIEIQVVFMQHLLGSENFTIIPILCGSFQNNLFRYSRKAYLDKAGPFLDKLEHIVNSPDVDTLVVAGVDFSHVGPKFGHDHPAAYLENQAKAHDQNLLHHLSGLDIDQFWEESKKLQDRFNVCGFPAMACLLEILPSCQGQILKYEMRHETATQSAVSFAAVVFT